MELARIEVVRDRTSASRCDAGFLRVSRLLLRNVYADGSTSADYACDVVSRPGSDAVVAALYRVEAEAGKRRVRVLLREGVRPPVYLRRHKRFVHPDPREYRGLIEVVAGIVEADDPPGPEGIRRRAAPEAEEEAGCRVPPAAFATPGGETFASPGTRDAKLYYCAAPADPDTARAPRGDGSAMEECARLAVCDLGEAIERCRTGEIPDMKTEIALLRLADHIGYLPQLGRFADELPAELRESYRRLGVEPPPAAP